MGYILGTSVTCLSSFSHIKIREIKISCTSKWFLQSCLNNSFVFKFNILKVMI